MEVPTGASFSAARWFVCGPRGFGRGGRALRWQATLVRRMPLPWSLFERDSQDLEVLGEGDCDRARRASKAAGSAGDRQHSRLGLLCLEAECALDGQAAVVEHDGDGAVCQGLLRVRLGDPGERAHAGVVADDRVAAADLVGGGDLIVDDQLIALGEDRGVGARGRDEPGVGGAVVNVEGVIGKRRGGAGGSGSRLWQQPSAARKGEPVSDRGATGTTSSSGPNTPRIT